MKQAEKDSLLADIDAGLLLLNSTGRPSPQTINRAVTIFGKVKVACQTIAISPTTDETAPPTPGPEDPPVDPPPPDPDPGGDTEPPPVTTVTTTYTSVGDFSGTQGFRGWYYMSADGTNLTYSTSSQLWTGTETYQGIWSSGQHPGGTNGAQRRWVAQGNGTFAITGQVSDADLGSPGNNVLLTIKKNGTTIYTTTVVSGSTTATTFPSTITGSCAASDTFDFITSGVGGISFASTNLTVSIALTTQNTTGGGNPTQTTLPFTLNGTAPQEGTFTLNANKPANADGCTIAITGVNLAAAYGRCYFNGSVNSLAIWSTAPGNVGVTATVTLTVPVAYMINGANTLRFTHDSGTGYTITAIATPVFTTPVTPTPPATQTSLPFILNGAILPEDGLLTLNLSKPGNANGCTMTVTGLDLDSVDGTLTVNGSSNSMSIFPVNAANNGVSRTVTLTPNVNWFVNGSNALRFTHSTGDGFTVTSVQVTFSVPPVVDPIPDPGAGTWPNLPSGMTVILNEPFSNSLSSIWQNYYNTQSFANISSAPLSPPTVFDSYLAAFSTQGNGQWGVPCNGAREVYFGTWWSTNADFQGIANNGNKMISFHSPNGGGNSFLFWRGLPYAARTITWLNQTGPYGNADIAGSSWDGDADGRSGVIFPNLNFNAATMTAGSGWYRLEVYLKCSSTTSTPDGILRWWVNGVPCGNFSYRYAGSAGISTVQINHTWDGSPIFAPPSRDWSKEWHHYWDHMIVAIR